MTPSWARISNPASVPQELQASIAQERQVSQDHAEDQLAEHRGLVEPLEQLAAQLGRREDEH